MKMAADVERQRMNADKAAAKEIVRKTKDRGERIINKIESIFNNRVTLLKEKLEEERYERKVSQQAQLEAMASLNKDLKEQQRGLKR